MSGLELIIAKLFSTTAITTAVGQKIYPGMAPQNISPPYLVVYKPGQENRQLLAGSAKFPKSRITIEAHGKSASEANDLGELLMQELEDVTNEVVSSGSPPTALGTITITPADSDVDDYDDVQQSYRRVIDFYVDWRAAP